MMKRPGLFACYAILKRLRFTKGTISSLRISTPGLRNRTDYAGYLELLTSLGWVRKTVEDVPSKDLGVWKKVTFYEITDLGKAFYDLFPMDDEKIAELRGIISRPGLYQVKKLLETCSENSDGGFGITSFTYLCAEEPRAVGNRRNCIRYLKLLVALGFLEKKYDEYLLESFYDLTGEGELFLRSFPIGVRN